MQHRSDWGWGSDLVLDGLDKSDGSTQIRHGVWCNKSQRPVQLLHFYDCFFFFDSDEYLSLTKYDLSKMNPQKVKLNQVYWFLPSSKIDRI